MDKSKILGKSKISYGKESNRIYLMDLHPNDFPEIIGEINHLAKKENYTKLFVKIPAKYAPGFIIDGYFMEAAIPGFYNGTDDAFFMVKYSNEERKMPEKEALTIFQELLLSGTKSAIELINENYLIRELYVEDINMMIPVFKAVFETYPFPIFEASFLKTSILEDGTRYFGVFNDEKLVAISSSECNIKYKNAEMTDFAVVPEHRGQKLANHLLAKMETQLACDGYKTFYTIARLHSAAMNKTFYNAGYKYSGTLTQNTQISGKIESMNVWYKNIER